MALSLFLGNAGMTAQSIETNCTVTLEQVYGALVESTPIFGERQLARGAVEQSRAQVLLELGHLPRQRRG